MKIKLFNGVHTNVTLSVIGGGYDSEIGRVVLVVQGDDKLAGTIQLEPAEAGRLGTILATAPKVERVEAKPPSPLDPLAQK
jgi:hypothetical protein